MPTPTAAKSAAVSIRPSEAVFADLHTNYDSGQLIIFAGAGISMAADLPSWPALAQKLRARLVKEGKAAEAISEIDNLIQSKQLIDALSAMKSALGATEFNIAIERAVDDTGRPIPDVAKAIAELQSKLRGVITTNLDRFLERAFNGEWDEVTTAPGNLAQQRHFIWKLHGTRTVRGSWVFTRGQYDRATFGQQAQRGLFEALFRSFPLLFVGYGMVDDDFDQTLASIRALSGDQPPHHYALLKGPLGSYQREKLQESGIRLLEYGEHGDVPAILRALPSGKLPPVK